MGSKKNKKKAVSKVFRGNQHAFGKAKKGRKKQVQPRPTPPRDQQRKRVANDDTPLSRSSKKIRLDHEKEETSRNIMDFFYFMNFSVLKHIVDEVVQHVVACKAKHPKVDLEHLEESKMGFAQKFKISCKSCSWFTETFSSPVMQKGVLLA